VSAQTRPALALGALAEKYARLLALAMAPAATQKGADAARRRDEKRAIARAFPGALRELDALDTAGLAARAQEVERAIAMVAHDATWDSLPEDLRWLHWMFDFHSLAKQALDARATGGREDRGRARLLDAVFRELCRRHGATAHEIRAALFPRRAPPTV
jgi:aminopeptidase N